MSVPTDRVYYCNSCGCTAARDALSQCNNSKCWLMCCEDCFPRIDGWEDHDYCYDCMPEQLAETFERNPAVDFQKVFFIGGVKRISSSFTKLIMPFVEKKLKETGDTLAKSTDEAIVSASGRIQFFFYPTEPENIAEAGPRVLRWANN